MPYQFDPEIQPVIEYLPALDITDVHAARQMLVDMSAALPAFEPPPGMSIERRTIPGPADNPDLEVIVIRPDEASSNAPGLLYIHGGGFVLGDAEGDMAVPTQLATAASAVVVSVDYRLAPEHPYPAPIEDCFAALQWLAGNAGELGVDAERIAIGGVSAGGGLAAGLALLNRDRSGPSLCFQLLDIPEVDDRLETHSMRTYTDTPIWHRSNAINSWKYYLGDASEVPVYAAPARATDLTDLPPAYVSVCEFDPLRDEGIAYAQALVQSGIPTELHLFPGTFHGSGGMTADAGVSKRMRAELLDAFRRGVAPRLRAAAV